MVNRFFGELVAIHRLLYCVSRYIVGNFRYLHTIYNFAFFFFNGLFLLSIVDDDSEDDSVVVTFIRKYCKCVALDYVKHGKCALLCDILYTQNILTS